MEKFLQLGVEGEMFMANRPRKTFHEMRQHKAESNLTIKLIRINLIFQQLFVPLKPLK